MDMRVEDRTQLVVTPHPVLIENQRVTYGSLSAGESLYSFLQRNVPELENQEWHAVIGGREVPRHLWHHVFPKDKQVIELRGAVKRNVLYIVAFIVLMYFTWGAGGAAAAGGGWAAGLGATGAFLAYTAVFIAGSMLINKVLGPKIEKAGGGQQADSVYTIGAARNQMRQYQPLGLLFGSLRIAPDYASIPYSWYSANDQYISMLLTPGINVDRVDAIYNNDTVLTEYEGTQLYFNGFAGMPDDKIPMNSNVDSIAGATLEPGDWVLRTTSPDTVGVYVDLEYVIYATNEKGKPKYNSCTFTAQWAPTGTEDWTTFAINSLGGGDPTQRRRSFYVRLEAGQYDIRVRRFDAIYNGNGAQDLVNWTTLRSIQEDTASYTGIPRIGITLKATGQFNGYPDELRMVAHAGKMPIWNGVAWQTATERANGLSNPGAQLLQYARGFWEDGMLLGGIGLSDAQIDIESLKGFMLHCTANGFTYDNYIKDQRNHDDVCAAIALAGMGQITWAGGRFGVTWAADEQPMTAIVNMATIKKGEFQVDYTLANPADGIEYTFYDRATWEAKTLRVPAPGVTTMMNPAQLTGEGVTDEAHAAIMARYHLGQSLYQWKDISFSTDIEHLTYRRLSVLGMQHDMTRWGYGGRIERVEGSIIHLDAIVPGPVSGNAYIGIRVPGENVYRVLPVLPVVGETDSVQLVDGWPVDVPVPGDAASDNPAHDHIWIYDFKSVPGRRVRVVNVAPEGDMTGASVSVVEEPEEFWTYVKTGEYIPPPIVDPVQTKPVASDLLLQEIRMVQANTTYSEIAASFEITGVAEHTEVFAALEDNEFERVASVTGRTARWRVEFPGTYNVVVRPFDENGNVGVPVTGIITTSGAFVPPVNVDTFDVIELDGGVRKYTWAFLPTTIQSPDYAGVEIRYISGNIGAPVWEEMTPVGDDGFFTTSFESVEPIEGDWTFAIRAKSTQGALSTDYLRIFKNLGRNLGEQLGEVGQDVQELIDEFNLEKERLDGVIEDLTFQAENLAELNRMLGAKPWDAETAYVIGDVVQYGSHLYRAKAASTGVAPTDVAYWDDIGEYTNIVEAQSVAISDLNTRVTTTEDSIIVLASDVDALAAVVAGKADASAITALQTQIDAQALSISAMSSAITSLQATVSTQLVELVRKGAFEDNVIGLWTGGGAAVVAATGHPAATKALEVSGTATEGAVIAAVPCAPNDTFDVKFDVRTVGMLTGTATFGVEFLNAANAVIGTSLFSPAVAPGQAWSTKSGTLAGAAPATTVKARAIVVNTSAPGTPAQFVNMSLVRRSTSVAANASAIQALDTRVTTAEGQITASATAITNVQASLVTSPNLVYNPSGGNGFVGWIFVGTSQSYCAVVSELYGKQGSIFRFMLPNGVAFDAGIGTHTDYYMPFTNGGGRSFVVSADIYRHQFSGTGNPTLQLRFYNASKVEIDAGNRPLVTITTNGWGRYSVTGVAPAGTAFVQMVVRQTSTSTAQAYLGVANVKGEAGTTPTVFTDDRTTNQTASATTALEVRATSLENGQTVLNAKYTLTLDVNGYISGLQSVNTGTSSTFTVLASVFRIVDPSGGARTEYSNGNWRVYDASNVLRVRMGIW